MENYSTDVIVIGSGGAGLRAAIAAAQGGAKCLLISRSTPGLATATTISNGVFGSSGFGMSEEEYTRATLETGYHLNDPELVSILSNEAPVRLREVRDRGARFTEGRPGVVTVRMPPDSGREVVDVLIKWAEAEGVQMLNWCTVARLLTYEGVCCGITGVRKDGETLTITAKAVVLCSGGASALFKHHDNPFTNIGDGYAMARDAGATLKDMEFDQFYPLIANEPHLPRLLIQPFLAEAGRIVNDRGEDILQKYGLNGAEPVALRARDKTSRVIHEEYRSGSQVYLDLRHLKDRDWQNGFAHNVQDRLESLFNTKERMIRILPVAHFTIGGIVIDQWGRTGVDGLFAAGEVACGVHGANRMGGNALSETLVFGFRAGKAAAEFCRTRPSPLPGAPGPLPGLAFQGVHTPRKMLQMIKDVMWNHCGAIRNAAGLSTALKAVGELQQQGIRCDNAKDLALAAAVSNGLSTARIIVESALNRKESVGAHFRED